MISDEAVEVAAKRIGDAVTCRDIRTILTAAAPYMLAGAWDAAVIEGESCGWLHDYATNDLRNRNPYRSQA